MNTPKSCDSPFGERLRRQIEEINRYKWLESERLGYDIGSRRATREWIEKYADAFGRFWAEHHHCHHLGEPTTRN
ncbi:hypothetical protein GX586_01440 [bacterium]|nr:hypothetical protein [bacterium]